MTQEDEAQELFLNPEWRRIVSDAAEARAALVQGYNSVRGLQALGRIQGRIEELTVLIEYESLQRQVPASGDLERAYDEETLGL